MSRFFGGVSRLIKHWQWHNEQRRVLEGIRDDIDEAMQDGQSIRLWIEAYDKRTLKQNAYLWTMFGQIADEMSRIEGRVKYTKEDAHDYLLQIKLGVQKRKVGKETIVSSHQTRNMTAPEVCELIEWCLAWAAERHMSVMMPEGYEQWAREAR